MVLITLEKALKKLFQQQILKHKTSKRLKRNKPKTITTISNRQVDVIVKREDKLLDKINIKIKL